MIKQVKCPHCGFVIGLDELDLELLNRNTELALQCMCGKMYIVKKDGEELITEKVG